MLFEVNELLEIKELDLFIAKPNKQIIGHLTEAYNKRLFPKMGSLSELSFTVPYQTDKNNRLINNKNIDKLKDRYLIKAIYDNKVEWFRISGNNNSSDENGDTKEIHAFSLGIELGDKIVSRIDEVSKDAQYMLKSCLSETGWTAGLVDNELLGKFRSFEVMETTKLDFLYQIAETFRGVVVWDTVNKQINLRDQNNVGSNKGLRISYGKYLKSLRKETNSDEMVTRLIPRGRSDLTIRSISPTGVDYIDDFSFFIYPFQRDENKNVIKSSDYMSDDLCHALLDFTDLLHSKEGEFTTLLEERNASNEMLLSLSGELSNLEIEYRQILDSIDIEQSNNRSITELNQQKENKETEIRNKESEIENIQSELDANLVSLQSLQSLLSPDNNFTSDELFELNSYIIEKRWTDDNIIDTEDLLKEAEKVFEEMRKPKTVITVDIVSFLQLLEGERDWGKLNIGDTIYIENERIGVNVTAKIIEFEINFEDQTINLTIANTTDILSDEDRFIQRLYDSQQTSLTVDLDKYKWNETGETVSEIGRLIENEWDATKRRIVAGVNESVVIDNRGISITNPEKPNEVLIAQAGVLAISDDNRQTWKHAITSQGIVGERIFGKLLAGERLVIDASNQHGTSIFRVDGSGVSIEGSALTISGGLNKDQLDPSFAEGLLELNKDYTNGIRIDSTNGIVVTRSDDKVKSIMNATHGIKISKNNGTISSPEWEDMLYADTDGNLIANNLVTRKISIRDNDDNTIIDADSGTIDFSKFPNKIGVIPYDHLEVKGLTVTNGSKETFKIDRNGNVSIDGNITMTNGSISWESVNPPTASQVGALGKSQSEVFNALTNNGVSQGLYMSGGDLYLNASYINGGTINGITINAGTVSITDDRITSHGEGDTLYIESGWMQMSNNSSGSTMQLNSGYIGLSDYLSTSRLDSSGLSFSSSRGYSSIYVSGSENTLIFSTNKLDLSSVSNINWGNNAPIAKFG